VLTPRTIYLPMPPRAAFLRGLIRTSAPSDVPRAVEPAVAAQSAPSVLSMVPDVIVLPDVPAIVPVAVPATLSVVPDVVTLPDVIAQPDVIVPREVVTAPAAVAARPTVGLPKVAVSITLADTAVLFEPISTGSVRLEQRPTTAEVVNIALLPSEPLNPGPTPPEPLHLGPTSPEVAPTPAEPVDADPAAPAWLVPFAREALDDRGEPLSDEWSLTWVRHDPKLAVADGR
jgi:hypothetical protein